jgi:autotransporter-associated beta strand protein
VIVYSGGILNVTHSITVDGSGAALIVVDNGAVGIATSSILNIGLASDASNVTPALIIQGNGGAVIGPTTVSLNSAVAQIDFELGGSYTFGNVVTGVGQVVQEGPATVTLTADNSYSGSTVILSGTLQIGSGGTTGSLGSGGVLDNGTLAYDRSDVVSITNAISGSGAVSFSGGGEFALFANNSYSGQTTIAAGSRLDVDSGGKTGTLGTGAVVDNGVLAFDRADAVIVNNNISGSGELVQFTGALTLTGDNTYTGPTFVQSGTLKAGAIHALGSDSAVTVAGGATLDINGFGVAMSTLAGSGTVDNTAATTVQLNDTNNLNSTFGGVIQNTGGALTLFKGGSGTLTLTGANTYSGGTDINQGTLQIGDGGTTGTLGAGNVNDQNSDSTRAFDRSDDVFVSQAISGAGAVRFDGGGALILLGNNSYSGNTTISSGQVDVGNDTKTGTLGTGAVNDNGALLFGRSDTITVANAISGTGQVYQSYGATILTGNNSYAGKTFIVSGVLEIGSGGTTGTLGTGGVTDNGALTFFRSNR